MKVLMQNRPTTFALPGGDTIQMLKTKEYLEKLSIAVDISLEQHPNVASYDLVHVFNMQDCAVQHSYFQILNAKKQGRPVALSTIYWNFSELNEWITKTHEINRRSGAWNWGQMVNSALRKIFKLEIKRLTTLAGLMRAARDEQESELIKCRQLCCLILSDTLLPNAKKELDILSEDFGISLLHAHVIPNAVDRAFMNADGRDFIRKYGLKDFVLSVGRIETTKNQLLLIRALKSSGIPLVLIGNHNNEEYWKQCTSEADENVLFLNHMPHEELVSAYGAARVHVLPSWRETPGLVSLEAGLAGCNIVVTNRGSTEEYFGDFANYCEPDDVLSIRNAVLQAYEAPKNSALAEHILKNFTWEKAAERTLEAYRTIIST